jgi:hypothetical protein
VQVSPFISAPRAVPTEKDRRCDGGLIVPMRNRRHPRLWLSLMQIVL